MGPPERWPETLVPLAVPLTAENDIHALREALLHGWRDVRVHICRRGDGGVAQFTAYRMKILAGLESKI
jgi:hypothetical protein